MSPGPSITTGPVEATGEMVSEKAARVDRVLDMWMDGRRVLADGCGGGGGGDAVTRYGSMLLRRASAFHPPSSKTLIDLNLFS